MICYDFCLKIHSLRSKEVDYIAYKSNACIIQFMLAACIMYEMYEFNIVERQGKLYAWLATLVSSTRDNVEIKFV